MAADLAASVPTGTSGFTNVEAGRSIIDYGNSFGPLVAYSGATSFEVGDRIITISDLSIDRSPAGSLTLNVREVPAPATFALFASAGIVTVRRRR